MADILRDSIWQFIGVVVSIIALAVSIYVIFSQSQKRSLAYRIAAETNLLQVSEEIRHKVKILYEDTPLKNVYFMRLSIINNGNVEIRASNFERPLSFGFGINARIISAETVQVEPENLDPIVSIFPGKVVLEPLLLNSKDVISIKLLIAEYSGEVWADARVAGVKRLTKLKTAPSFEPTIIVVVNYLLMIACIVSFGFIVGSPFKVY